MRIKGQKKKLIILSVIALLLITVGISYAALYIALNGSKENSIKLGNITFVYKENSNIGNGITITDAFPISDSEGKSQDGTGKVFDFQIESAITTNDLEYEIVAEETENSNLPLDAIKFYLTEIVDEEEEEIASSYDIEGNVKTLDNYDDTLINNVKGKTIYQNTISANTENYLKKFRARMWIKEGIDWSSDEYINKSGAIRVNVYVNSDRQLAIETTPSDVSIRSIKANNDTFTFQKVSAADYQYILYLDGTVNELSIEATPNNDNATYTLQQINDSELILGDNFFNLTVTSSNGEVVKIYKLKVVKKRTCLYDIGYTWEFNYTGGEQTLLVPCDATYKLETWGAQGGTANITQSSVGGAGGYATGLSLLSQNETIYINVGGVGIPNNNSHTSIAPGGYNGGGNAGYVTITTIGEMWTASGGGATHIAKTSGLLRDLSNNRESILIVSGGGGGGFYHNNNNVKPWGDGGSGGGFNGGNGNTYGSGYAIGLGGTQTSAQSNTNGSSNAYIGGFGYGGYGVGGASASYYFSGGGGGFYGGGSTAYAGAGGGSGYIGNSLLISSETFVKHMTCYNCPSSDDTNTKTITTTNSSATAISDYAKLNNGYAKITLIELN